MSATSRLAAGPPSSKSTFWPVVLMRFDCTGTRLPHPTSAMNTASPPMGSRNRLGSGEK